MKILKIQQWVIIYNIWINLKQLKKLELEQLWEINNKK